MSKANKINITLGVIFILLAVGLLGYALWQIVGQSLLETFNLQ